MTRGVGNWPPADIEGNLWAPSMIEICHQQCEVNRHDLNYGPTSDESRADTEPCEAVLEMGCHHRHLTKLDTRTFSVTL